MKLLNKPIRTKSLIFASVAQLFSIIQERFKKLQQMDLNVTFEKGNPTVPATHESPPPPPVELLLYLSLEILNI